MPGPPGTPADASALVTLATAQTITGAKTFQATTTCATLNATTLQVGGVNIIKTYAPLANPSFTGTVTTPNLTVPNALEVTPTSLQTLEHLECLSGFRVPIISTSGSPLIARNVLGGLLRCTGSGQSITLISPTAFPGGYFEVIVTNTTAFSIFEGTFTGPAGNGANNISLSTTPTPHYRMISNGSNWLVHGVGDSVRLSGAQTIAGEKTFTSETNARGLRLSPA